MHPTESAVVVRIPEAEGVVGRFRADLDLAAPLGVPAHVTVISPFVAPAARRTAGRIRTGCLT
ncbi:MAG TPA: hypothetical protein VEM58_13815 [Streptosporangiaceae bacterium]|nr:hypothetical protein [Streptosporangiaceae bacterium]